jgi:hypothetical protein
MLRRFFYSFLLVALLSLGFGCKSSKRDAVIGGAPQRLVISLLQMDKAHQGQKSYTYTLTCPGVTPMNGTLEEGSAAVRVSYMVTGVKVGDVCEVKVIDPNFSQPNVKFTKEDKMIYYAPKMYITGNPVGGLTGSAVLQKAYQLTIEDARVVVNITFEDGLIPPDVENYAAQLTCDPFSLVATDPVKEFDASNNRGLYLFPVQIGGSGQASLNCKNLTLFLNSIPRYQAIVSETLTVSAGDSATLKTLARLSEMTFAQATGLDVTVQIITGCQDDEVLDLDTGKCVKK